MEIAFFFVASDKDTVAQKLISESRFFQKRFFKKN